jgi:hypothetical protein
MINLYTEYISFWGLTAVIVQISVFSVMIPCLVDGYQCLGGTSSVQTYVTAQITVCIQDISGGMQGQTISLL